MDELLNMGFPTDLAAQALAATGGKSLHHATEWLLNPNHNNNSSSSSIKSPNFLNPNFTPSQSQSQSHQPKLDRFFHTPQSQNRIAPPSNDDVKNPNPKRRKSNPHEPLSERMRPRSINHVVGQDHLLSKGSMIRSAMECNRLPSLIFWGPPGTGKTSIAKAIFSSLQNSASNMKYQFVSLSAVTCGVKEVREAVDNARKMRVKSNVRTVLFVDEVHRFNKSQQDSFLPIIEDGSIVFMGATTENPSFHLITPLLSRCRVLTLNPLRPEDVVKVLERAVSDVDKGVCCSVGMKVEVCGSAIEFLAANCDGDARVALNALEISATTAAARFAEKQLGSQEEVELSESVSVVASVTLDDVKEALQCKHLAYDKAGDEHYNLISALHKSMRGSDGNASIYWLARMLEGGEQPLYIARRLIRFASEDVGLADPFALSQAVACYQACHFLGMPECNVILAQCAAYLALAPKSVSVYKAINAAQKVVRESVGQNEGVPLHLRNAPTKLMQDLGYAKDYIYPPDEPLLAAGQSYLPPSLQGYKFLDLVKKQYELGRQPANTKLSSNKTVRRIRVRGGNVKWRALRLDTGNFSWGSEATTRKTRILDVVYNASNNELVRTQPLVKGAIVQVDAAPFKQWYLTHYGVEIGRKKKPVAGFKKEGEEAEATTEEAKKSAHVLRKLEKRQRGRQIDPHVEEQFSSGRLLAAIASRPGQHGRADGYILEAKELEFYTKKLQKKKGKGAGAA